MNSSGDSDDVSPFSAIQPQGLSPDALIQFDCHPGVRCYNACCRQIDIQLTPYDIIRLKRRLGLSASQFVAGYTMPFEMDHHGMPGLKLAMKPGSQCCVFLEEKGCSVYEDRPVACRYYALGRMVMRKKDASKIEDIYFVVRESHCKGHFEPVERTVREYLDQQGVAEYERANREWMDIIIRKRSAGPAIGAPSARSLQLFDMCSYDIDGFRQFVCSRGFRDVFDIPEAEMSEMLSSDVNLLAFGMRFLKQVLFGENSLRIKEGAREKRARAREAARAQR